MFVPHETGAHYKIAVYDKATQTDGVWEGHATNLMDAFDQARRWIAGNREAAVPAALSNNGFGAASWVGFKVKQLES